MSKNIEFDFGGEHYKLQYSKRTVKILESSGFDIDTAEKTPVTSAETLFAGAFLCCHEKQLRKDPELPGKVWKHIPDKTGFLQKLIELYNDPLQQMFQDPEEDDGKNVNWTANF